MLPSSLTPDGLFDPLPSSSAIVVRRSFTIPNVDFLDFSLTPGLLCGAGLIVYYITLFLSLSCLPGLSLLLYPAPFGSSKQQQ